VYVSGVIKPDWENLDIISRNKEDAHALALAYDDAQQALTYAQGFDKSSSPMFMSLDGYWKFYHGRGVHLPGGYASIDHFDGFWRDISVPVVWQLQGFGTPYYYANSYPQAIDTEKSRIPNISRELQEFGIYRRTFFAPVSFAGHEVYLHFGGAKAAIEVYLNGEYVGYSQGSMTPHEFNVTDGLCEGENQLTVVVWRYSDGTYLEDQDMWFFSGLYREVYLYAEPRSTVRDFYMHSELDPLLVDATANLQVTVENRREAVPIKVKASIPALGLVIGEQEAIISGSVVMNMSVNVSEPLKWSHEQPNLYTVLLEWESGDKLWYKAFRFGFRKVEIEGNILKLNGKNLVIRGINRHDFDPDTGWTLSVDRYHQDIRLLKQMNINAIRTAHYPNNPILYQMCDAYGILVMDEADIESHGARNKLPASDLRWDKHCTDRVQRMVLRDRNHPCIIFWSLGNEAGSGENFSRMYDAIRQLDRSRPIHYEGSHKRSCTDVISRMYPTEKNFRDLCEQKPLKASMNPLVRMAMDDKPVSASRYKNAPVLLCEYAHCMENSLGNFYKYIEGFENNEHMCGGFIWDFADQTIRREGYSGEEWLYGDDYREIFNKNGFKKRYRTGSSGIFCANGVVAADRTPHPAAMEVKKGYQLLHVEPAGGAQNDFLVINNQMFNDLSAYRLLWRLECDGETVMEGEVPAEDFAATPPGESTPLRLEEFQLEALRLEDVSQTRGEGEYSLIFCFIQSGDTSWAKAGYEQAFTQILFAPEGLESAAVKDTGGASLKTRREDETFYVEGKGFKYTFERGVLSSIKADDVEFLLKPVIPNLWRAATDNDNGYGNFFPLAKLFTTAAKWRKAQTKQIPLYWHKLDVDGGIEVVCEWKHPLCRKLHTFLTVYPDGSLDIEMRLRPKRIDAVRIGMRFVLTQGFEQVVWYGRGPHECYPDRKLSTRVSKYSTTIEELGHRYVRPQENGSRCDVRWLSVSSVKRTLTVRDLSGSGLIFSAWHYEQEDLAAASHDFRLMRKPLATLNIDSTMRGVGGDLPGIAALHDEYRLRGNREYILRAAVVVEKNNIEEEER
jgi:beta-galactosidase